MPNVVCSVDSCCHNKTGVCFSTSLCISGRGATDSVGTNCGSYLNASSYSNIANLVSDSRPADYITCSADNCVHNYNGNCQADSINVTTNSTLNYSTDTECASFQQR